MPGLHIFYNKKSEINKIDFDLLKHEENYTHNIIFRNEHLIIANTGYKGYPIISYEDKKKLICIEGIIYNKSEIEINTELSKICSAINEEEKLKNKIRNLINNYDGDFIIVLFDKIKNNLLIFNDLWGRLPSFFYHDENIFIFSREQNFILNNIPIIEFDKKAILEFLTFEFTLGDKSLIANVFRANPAELFIVNTKTNYLLREQIEKIIFNTNKSKQSKNDIINKVANLFEKSVKSRIDKLISKKYNLTADLSGGFDSRAVFFELCKNQVDIDFFTDYLITGDESEIAKKLAELFKKNVTLIKADHNFDIVKAQKITFQIGCTVNCWTSLACYNDSYQRKKILPEQSVKFGGFGGEFIRHPYQNVGNYKTILQLINDRIYTKLLTFEQSCSLLNINKEKMIEELKSYFSTYEENSIDDKIKHLYFEYYKNLVNSGEDRARIHIWTIQPLMSKDLMMYYFKNIPRNLIDENLFIKFLRKINPQSLKIPIYKSIRKLDSKIHFIVFGFIYKILRFKNIKGILYSIRKIITPKKKETPETLRIKNMIKNKYSELKKLNLYFDKKALNIFLQKEHNSKSLYILLTLILYFNEIEKHFLDKTK